MILAFEVANPKYEEAADVDKAANYGRTPLFMASQDGHLEVVRLLVEKGADVDKADYDDHTPLYIADLKGHFDIVDLLE